MGLSPANSSAGNVTKVPPPASEFRAPPRNAAAMRTIVVMSGGMWGLYEAVNSAVPRRELGSKVGILARGRTYNLHKLPEM
jgi:hypothetical protein